MIAATLGFLPTCFEIRGNATPASLDLSAIFAAERSPARFGRLGANWRIGPDGRPTLGWRLEPSRSTSAPDAQAEIVP